MRLPVVMRTAASVTSQVNEVKPPGVAPWRMFPVPKAARPPSASVSNVYVWLALSPESLRLKVTVPPRARAPPVSRRRVSVLPPSPGLATSPMLSASVAVPVPAPVPRLSAVSAARSLPTLSPARLSVAPGPTVSAVTSAGCVRPPGRARRAPPEADRALVAVTGPLKVRMPPSASVAPWCA